MSGHQGKNPALNFFVIFYEFLKLRSEGIVSYDNMVLFASEGVGRYI